MLNSLEQKIKDQAVQKYRDDLRKKVKDLFDEYTLINIKTLTYNESFYEKHRNNNSLSIHPGSSIDETGKSHKFIPLNIVLEEIIDSILEQYKYTIENKAINSFIEKVNDL